MATVTKFCHDGGLGISLEGNIDIGNGIEARPHHYINSILPNGPVGRNGLLKKGEELLEVSKGFLFFPIDKKITSPFLG